MSSAITNAGEALIAQKQNQEAALVIDKIILAKIDGIDPAAPVDRAAGKPDAGDIVFEYNIPDENKGYINPNQVVYSLLLTSDIGDFDFNWIGLYSSAEDTVIAIAHIPVLSKWQTAHPKMGNTLTRNFMLEYTGLQATTQIVVEAATWQIDFTARMKGIDERERLSNRDIYGGACFFDDGFKVINRGSQLRLLPGVGYVEGIRIEQNQEDRVNPPSKPAQVYLDVSLQPQGSDRVAVAKMVYADPGDYTDNANIRHYGQKIAEITTGKVVTDCRPKALAGVLGGTVAEKDHSHDNYADKKHQHTAAQIGLTPPAGLNANNVQTAIDKLVSREPGQATTIKAGLVEQATQSEVDAGTDAARYVSPKTLKNWSGGFDGTVALISTRTSTGNWTLSGVDPGKPIFLGFSGTLAHINVTSGGLDVRTADSVFSCMGATHGNNGYALSGTIIPNSNTVTINVKSLTGTLHAYQ